MQKINQLTAYDGIKLFSTDDLVHDADANIVIVHGLGEHSGRYAYLTERMNESQYNVFRFDLRGHGKSEGESAFLNDYHDYIKDLQTTIDHSKSVSPDKKTYLLGHSMGGFISALYGMITQDGVDGIILSGAATQTPKQAQGMMGTLVKIMGTVVPKAAMSNDLGKVVSRDPAVVQAYLNDPLNKKKITFALYNEFLIKGIGYVKSHLADFRYPTLILHGENDLIVDPHASQILYDSICSYDKTLKLFPGLYHEIFNEPERDNVIEIVLNWLENAEH
ncbi:MAG: lysophospholipase [Anaerofustis sp.]